MISYIVSTVLCSGLLWMLYYFFGAKEKMYIFNRFYLLLIIPFSLLVPLIKIRIAAVAVPVVDPQLVYRAMPYAHNAPIINMQEVAGPYNYLPLLMGVIYLAVTIALLGRFVKNLYLINGVVARGELVIINGSKIILTDKDETPHSFLKYIFISKRDYQNGTVEPQIICHEQAHIKQGHSFDIIGIELLQAICWFNPFVPLLRSAIKLNHEFLADEAVIRKHNTPAYQYLLLARAGQANGLMLTSQFSYLTTKKRLIMMTKNTSASVKLYKQLALIPVLAGACMLFSQKVPAQTKLPAQKQAAVVAAKDDAPQDIMSRYAAILSKYALPGTFHEAANFPAKISAGDRKQLNILFKQMSKEQQQQQTVIFRPCPKPLPRVSPNKEQLDAWQKASEYGVWIDGKQVSNTKLADYSPADFDQVFVSRLTKAAINYNKYHYQVDLMTKAYYADYYKKELADNEDRLLVHRPGTRFM